MINTFTIIDDYDGLHSDYEERIMIVEFVLNVPVVIYTECADRNRIISARRANKRDNVDYLDNSTRACW